MDLDLITQQETLRRRRALLDTLAQQGREAPIAGPAKFALPTALAKVATAAITGRRGRELDAEASALEGRRTEELGQEARQILDLQTGRPGEIGTVGDFEGLGGSMTPPTPADPRAAVLAALTSRFPALQEFGKSGLAGLSKPETFGQPSTFRGPDGKLQSVRFGNRGSTLPVQGVTPFERPTVVGDRVVDPAAPGQVLADFRERFGEPFKQEGDLFQTDTRGKVFKLDNAPKVTITNQLPADRNADKKFLETLGVKRAEQFTKAEERAVDASRAKGIVTQMRELDAQGVNSGPLANVATTLAALADATGVPVDKARLANSEVFQQQFAKQIAAVMLNGSIGRSMTDADRERFEQSIPRLLQSPAGRAQIYQIIEAEADTDIARFNSMQAELEKRFPGENLFNFNLANQQPNGRGALPAQPPVVPAVGAPGSAGTDAPIPLDEFLRQRRGQGR